MYVVLPGRLARFSRNPSLRPHRCLAKKSSHLIEQGVPVLSVDYRVKLGLQRTLVGAHRDRQEWTSCGSVNFNVVELATELALGGKQAADSVEYGQVCTLKYVLPRNRCLANIVCVPRAKLPGGGNLPGWFRIRGLALKVAGPAPPTWLRLNSGNAN